MRAILRSCRSTNGIDYAVIGTVTATWKHSSAVTHYSYNDAAASDSRNYYRLRIVDLDGSSELSKIISIRANANGITLNGLYPNPVTDELVIEWNAISNVKTQVTVRNLQGQLLQTSTVITVAGFNQLKLNTSLLPCRTVFSQPRFWHRQYRSGLFETLSCFLYIPKIN